jgi:hypothetical protein
LRDPQLQLAFLCGYATRRVRSVILSRRFHEQPESGSFTDRTIVQNAHFTVGDIQGYDGGRYSRQRLSM